MKIPRIFFILFILLFKQSYSQINNLFSVSNNLEEISDSTLWINLFTSVSGTAFSGNNFSSTDSIKQFGLGYKNQFPETCKNKNLHININEKIRANKTGTDFSMVVTVSNNDSVIFWEAKKINLRITKTNSWTEMNDEIDVPLSLTGDGFILTVFLWNSDGQAIVDIDDLKIDFSEKLMPSFLPVGFARNISNSGWKQISSNKSYSFLFNEASGQFMVINTSGDTIINSLAIYSEWTLQNKKERKQSWNYRFKIGRDSVSALGNYIRLSANDEIFQNEISVLAGINGALSFEMNSIILKPVMLYRLALVTGFSMPVKEVYKKSTLIDAENIKSEYWLNKEGFLLSNGKSSLVIYHQGKVSSIQLNVKNKYAVFNLDYSLDHPLLHYPLLKKSENKFEDNSASVYSKGSILKSTFSFYSVGPDFKNIRMLSNPYGYLSSMTWTEHADYTDLRTQKAVYLGSEKSNNVNNAIGGFMRYSIPVTKSIFYANPDGVNNSDKAGFMPGLEANYKETPGYRDFLRMLNESGIEVCLHTPDQYTTTRKILAEALEKTKNDFFPMTWIDHGYDNSKNSNREDMVCDGADSTSKWYAADLWKRYGIKYFWNSYFEDSGVYKSYSYNSFFSVPYSGWDESMPTPLYWRNISRSGDVIHWRTMNTLDPVNGNLWSYYFNDLRLSDMVKNRNDIIIHCYPARVDSTNGFYEIKDGIVVANEEFNQALSKLSLYRSQDKIRLTTIRDLLDYQISTEDISIVIQQDGNIKIINSGKNNIRGLSFSTLASDVTAGDKVIMKKNSENEFIFWLDISPGEVVDLKIK